MNLARLHAILVATTIQFRKGEAVEGNAESGGGVHVISSMPHVSEIAKTGFEKVDCHFIIVGVNVAEATKHRDELVSILQLWPTEHKGEPLRNLEQGPGYKEVGAVLNDERAAFSLFALGKVLGFWRIITPESLNASGPAARDMALAGMIMINGFNPGGSPPKKPESVSPATA